MNTAVNRRATVCAAIYEVSADGQMLIARTTGIVEQVLVFDRSYRSTATTRKPIWSYRRSGSNRCRNAEREAQPSSVQALPRRTRE